MKPIHCVLLLALSRLVVFAAAPSLDSVLTLDGDRADNITALAKDSQGDTIVVGNTTSTDFPTKNALQAKLKGFQETFVSKIDTNGALVFSTYLGGGSDDYATGVAVDPNGNIYVTGYTASTDFPTSNALVSTNSGQFDIFVTKLDSNGQLLYSTFIGGEGWDLARSIALDTQGNILLSGYTDSQKSFPLKNAYQSKFGGNGDAFVLKLSADGQAIVYATYLGGAGFENFNSRTDIGGALAVDASGNAYVTGWTPSTDFPVLNGFQSQRAGTGDHTDAFFAKFGPDGTLLFSSYLGGEYDDNGRGIALDAAGNIYITGSTGSFQFPLKNAAQAGDNLRDLANAFVTSIAPDGKSLNYSTYLAGSGADLASAISVDAAGNAAVAGYTESADFPLKDAVQPVGNQLLFRSTADAASWALSRNGLTGTGVKSLVAHPTDPKTVFAIVAGSGIFKTTDGGATWAESDTGIDVPTVVYSLAFDPKNPSTIYGGGVTGVFVSSDDGANWKQIDSGLPGDGFPSINVIVVDPSTPATLYVGTEDYGVYKSTDSGKTWSAANTGIATLGIASLAVDPQNGSNLFAGAQFNSGVELFKSVDGGANWTKAAGVPSGDVPLIAFDPNNSKTVYAILNGFSSAYLDRSSDGGVTWTNLLLGEGAFTFTALAVPANAPGTMYLGSDSASGQGVFKTTDAGLTWNSVGLSGDEITTLAVSPDGNSLLAGSDAGRDGFIVVLSPLGQITSSTYLGGEGADALNAIAGSPQENLAVAGKTSSLSIVGKVPRRETASGSLRALTIAANDHSDGLVITTHEKPAGGADIEVTLKADRDKFDVGDVVTLTVNVINHGDLDATDVTLTLDTQPEQGELMIGEGTSAGGVIGYDQGVLEAIYRFSKIPANARQVVFLKVYYLKSGQSDWLARAESSVFDPNLDNNDATLRLDTACPDISVSATIEPNPVPVVEGGVRGKLIAKIHNNGPDALNHARVFFTVTSDPAGWTFSPAFAPTFYGGEVGLGLNDSIPPSGDGSVSIPIIVYRGPLSFDVVVKTDCDPNPNNNSVSVTAFGEPSSIESVLPSIGKSGDPVTIKGFGLGGAASVNFNGVAAPLSLLNDYTIQTITPDGLTVPGPLKIVLHDGTILTAPSNFLPVKGAQPSVSLVTVSAVVGTTIDLFGANLDNAAVSIGGVSVGQVDVEKDVEGDGEHLYFIVPPGITGGTITVTTPNGTVIGGTLTVVPCSLTVQASPAVPPAGIAGEYYQPINIIASEEVSYSVSGLPDGLTLEDPELTGEWQIEGRPTKPGTYQVTITAQGEHCSASLVIPITILPSDTPLVRVTTSADSGTGSLRDAIDQANNKPGTTIIFNISRLDKAYDPATHTFKLQPTSALPTITAAGTRIVGPLANAPTGDTGVNQPSITIDGGLVLDSGPGLQVTGKDCVIQDLNFSNWVGDGVDSKESIELRGNCSFTDNRGDGIHCDGTLTTETVYTSGNSGWGITAGGDLRLNVNGAGGYVTATDCGKGGIKTEGSIIASSVHVENCGGSAGPGEGDGVSAKGNVTIGSLRSNGNAGAGLSGQDIFVGAGETADNKGDGLHANGGIQAEGTVSLRNGGYGVVAENGDADINLQTGGNSRVAENEKGGVYTPHGQVNAVNLECVDNKGTGVECESGVFQACTVDKNQGAGVQIDKGPIKMVETECSGNTGDGLICETAPSHPNVLRSLALAGNVISASAFRDNGGNGISYKQSTPLTIDGTLFSGNKGFAINNSSSAQISAEGDWWGSASGPSGAGPGAGDKVSAGVDFASWLTSAPVISVRTIGTPALGAGDSGRVFIASRNWQDTNDVPTFVINDTNSWAGLILTQIASSNGLAVLELPITIPTNTPAGMSNYISVSVFAAATNTSASNSVTFGLVSESLPPLRLTATPSSGGVQLQFEAAPGANYVLEISDDLTSWRPLFSRFATTASVTLSDRVPAQTPRRFYRIRRE